VPRPIPAPARRRRALAVAASLLLLAGVAAPAHATPDTFRRAVGNILQAPIDILLAPVVAINSVYTGIRDIDDSRGVRIAYALPGAVWYMGMNSGAAVLRGTTGAIELVPGIAFYFADNDLDPLMAPVERGIPLVAWQNTLNDNEALRFVLPLFLPGSTSDIRYGIDYMKQEF